MNLDDLNKLIHEIEHSIKCRDCKATFGDRDVRIIGTVFNEGFFHVKCPKCQNSMIINVVFTLDNRSHKGLRKNPKMKVVNKDDILDMRNFLEQFDGDFISLFSQQS